MTLKRPETVAILAMTADGKIADHQRHPARFGSARDKDHLEQQISLVDGVIFGSGTLQAYQTTLLLKNPELLANRQQQNKPLQPINIVVSGSGKINPNLRFFSQEVPHWLLTTIEGSTVYQKHNNNVFEKIIIYDSKDSEKIDFIKAFFLLKELGLNKVAILGGGELLASLLEVNLIDELWLTICPLILGGTTSPTPVEGLGFSGDQAKRLQLLTVESIDQEIFLHYRLHS